MFVYNNSNEFILQQATSKQTSKEKVGKEKKLVMEIKRKN